MKNRRPLISVVIPAYNEERYLPACLDSFRNQTFKDFEIIVIDNNSTDKTAKIARKFGAKVVKERKQGVVAARERGFKEAKGEILARTDADATASSNWLELIYKAFKSHPNLVGLTGDFISPYKGIPNWIFRGWSFLVAKISGHLFFGHIYLIGANMAIKKSAWEKIKVHPDESFMVEDGDLTCHLAEIGKIEYLPELTVTLSFRRVKNSPLRGTLVYFVEYPLRLLRTIWLHHPFFCRHKSFLTKVRKTT